MAKRVHVRAFRRASGELVQAHTKAKPHLSALERGERAERARQELVPAAIAHTGKVGFRKTVEQLRGKPGITNPEKLVYAQKQTSRKNEEKYDCYFAYSKHFYHRYILTINGKVIIVTIIKVNRDWQRAIERR